MIRFAILILVIALANGQLNYEGNPFTEYTEYIAEESNLSEKSARKNDASIDFSNPAVSRPQKLYPVAESKSNERSTGHQVETDNLLKSHISVKTFQSDPTARQFQDSPGNTPPFNQAEVALNSFLNSRTPEESRLFLDHYLRSQHSPGDPQSRASNAIIGGQEASKLIEPFNPQPISHVEQPHLMTQVSQQQMQLAPQMDQVQVQMPQLVPQTEQRQQLLPTNQAYDYVGQPAVVQSVPAMLRTPAGVVFGQKMMPVPLVPTFQPKNEMITSAMWRERMRRIRGKPFPFAQPRIAPGLYQGPIAGEKTCLGEKRRSTRDGQFQETNLLRERKNNNFLHCDPRKKVSFFRWTIFSHIYMYYSLFFLRNNCFLFITKKSLLLFNSFHLKFKNT